jgi:lysophospholipase L1-like esterase
VKLRQVKIILLVCILFAGLVNGCGGGGGGSNSPTPEPVPPPPNPSAWTLIAVGDSITYGINHDNPSEEGYVPKLSRLLGKNVINLGVPGATSGDVADHIVEYLERYHPTHVLLLVGANDVISFPWDVTHYIHVLQYIINTIRTYNAIPVVGTLTPFCSDYASDYSTRNINDRNEAIHQDIEKGMSVTIADFAAIFTCDMMEHNGGHHPNSWGYEVMAQIWYETLMKNPQY